MKSIYNIVLGLTVFIISCAKFPEADITNGIINAKIYLPDVEKGYYRSTRFDWSGNMPSLEYKGHSYFGQWFREYSPEIHDAIMGPVEDFNPIYYSDTQPGGSFIKPGVGVLLKPDNKPYSFWRLYPVINFGTWIVNKEPNQIQFIHELEDNSCSYRYEKIIRLVIGKPKMLILHTLKNTGNSIIETSVYNHNLFVIDKQEVGPGFQVIFPFNIIGEGPGIDDKAVIDGNKIVFMKYLDEKEDVYCDEIKGFGPGIEDYEIKVENHNTGAGVKITCDQPLSQLAFWSCSSTLCPEPYIFIKINPGQEFSWEISYEFYSLSDGM